MDEMQHNVEETTSVSASYTSCGVQCYLPIADTKGNASPQTEDMDPKCFVEQGVPVEELTADELGNVKVDHPYSAKELTPSPVKGHSGVIPAPHSPFPDSELHSSPLKPPKDYEDTDYVISSEEYDFSTDDEEKPTTETNKTYIEEPKYLICGSCLNGLLQFSPGCGHIVIESKFQHVGSLLSGKTTCIEGHVFGTNSLLLNQLQLGIS